MQDPKGFFTSDGYKGWVEAEGRYLLFASDSDYLEWLEVHAEDNL